MSSDAGSFQAEWNKCRTLSLKHFYKLNFSGNVLSNDSKFRMIGEVFEVCDLGVCSNSRVARKAEASYTHGNSMLLLCGAFEHIYVIMFTKAYSLAEAVGEVSPTCAFFELEYPDSLRSSWTTIANDCLR